MLRNKKKPNFENRKKRRQLFISEEKFTKSFTNFQGTKKENERIGKTSFMHGMWEK